MTRFVMCDRYDPGYGEALEAEPVVVDVDGGAVKLTLDDGGELVFDVSELIEAVGDARASHEERAA